MRGRLLFSFSIFAALAAAGCAVESSPDSDAANEEEGQRADELTAASGTAIWTKVYRPVSSNERVVSSAVASDANGDTFVIRTKVGLPLGSGVLESDLSRYSPTGDLELRRELGRGKSASAVAVGGGVVATLERDAETKVASVAAYDAVSGALKWRKDLSNGGVTPVEIAVDGSGRVVVTGRVASVAHIDFTRLYDQNQREYQGAFVAQFSAGGTLNWARRYGAATDNDTMPVNASAVAVDGDGEVFVTGTFGSDVDFGGGTIFKNAEQWSEDGSATPYRVDDGWVLKLSAAGTKRWATHISGAAEQIPASIGVTGAGRVAIAGNFRSEVEYDGGRVQAANGSSHFSGKVFFTKLDTAGKHVWSKTLEGTSDSYITVARVMLDADGRLVLAGSLRGTARQDGATYTSGSANFYAAFVGTFGATTGARSWLKTYGDAGSDVHANDAAITSSGRIMLGGDLRGTVNFGGGTITHSNDNSLSTAGFLTRLRE